MFKGWRDEEGALRRQRTTQGGRRRLRARVCESQGRARLRGDGPVNGARKAPTQSGNHGSFRREPGVQQVPAVLSREYLRYQPAAASAASPAASSLAKAPSR